MKKPSRMWNKYTLITALSAVVVVSLCLMLPGCSQRQLFRFDCEVYDSQSNRPLEGVAIKLYWDEDSDDFRFPLAGWPSENLTDRSGKLLALYYTSRTNPSDKIKWRLEFVRDGYETVNHHFGPIVEIRSNNASDNPGRVVVSHIFTRVCMNRVYD